VFANNPHCGQTIEIHLNLNKVKSHELSNNRTIGQGARS